MSDFRSFTEEQLKNPKVAREYYRLAPFYRLADQLVLLRKHRGMTQQELAAKANTTQAVISRLENVSVHCSLESVIRIAEALGAVVELKMIPSEELAQESVDAKCPDNQKDEISFQDGAVFFGKNQKVTSF